MADIFISYSKIRAAEASDLARELGDLGYAVWWDTSPVPTGSFAEEIERQLDTAKAAIVIWSPESVRSKWVRSEAAYGDRQDKLVNTHTSDLEPARIPMPFDRVHAVAVDEIRAIVRALDALRVPRSGGASAPAPIPTRSTSVADSDDRLFAEVERKGTVESYVYHLDELPDGRHAKVAKFRLRDLAPAEGRIRIEAKHIHGAPGGWFKPGNGKTEWFKDIDIGPEMVVVPPGAFTMGSNDYGNEKPPHKVTIAKPLAVGRFAVTFAEWDAAAAAGGVKHRPGDWDWGRGRWPTIEVSWNDATEYVAWLSNEAGKEYRLLSEAEWEYCCRAGTTTKYAFGDMISKSQAQFSEGQWGSAGSTVEVGKFAPNAWGLHDMHGNVWEWCEDNWHPNYQGAPSDGSVWPGGDTSLRVVRGGSWSNDNPVYLRSSDRSWNRPVIRIFDVGFRLARTLLRHEPA